MSVGFRMGRPETDIAEGEISRRQAAERELEAVRDELAKQVARERDGVAPTVRAKPRFHDDH